MCGYTSYTPTIGQFLWTCRGYQKCWRRLLCIVEHSVTNVTLPWHPAAFLFFRYPDRLEHLFWIVSSLSRSEPFAPCTRFEFVLFWTLELRSYNTFCLQESLIQYSIQWLAEAMLRRCCARSSCCVCALLGSGQIYLNVIISWKYLSLQSGLAWLCVLFSWYMLRRYGVAKYRVSEQEDMGEHVCSLRFVNELFIRKRTVFEELSNAAYHLLLHFAVVVKMIRSDSCVFSVQ